MTERTREAEFLLWAARETGAIDALAERAGTPEALSAETELTLPAAETVVRALDDLGFLERVGDEYEFTNRGLGFLAKRDLRSIGSLPADLDEIDALVDLPETMTTGDAPTPPANGLRNRLGREADADAAHVRARITAAVREHPDADTVLDIGGGAGTHAREFAARGLDATLLDGHEAIETVRPLLAPTDVRLEAGDLPSHDATYDLVFGTELATEMDPDEARFTVAAAAERVAAGGALVLVEPVRDHVSAERAVAGDVRGLALGGGRTHDAASYREWLAAAGLEPALRPIPGTDLTAVAGRAERTVQED